LGALAALGLLGVSLIAGWSLRSPGVPRMMALMTVAHPEFAGEPARLVAAGRADRPVTTTYRGRKLVSSYTRRMVVTAYCPCKICCGSHACGITASGQSVYSNGMKMVAADRALMAFGTLVSVPGYHGAVPVPVLDRGGTIKGDRLDVLLPTHAQALAWGKRTVEVTVWRYGDP
jgi:3D (Asp-Asp-Asp) domain-containing protein